MSAKFGVNVALSAKTTRNISIQSTTTIAVVGVIDGVDAGLKYFGSIRTALDELKGKISSIYPALQLIDFQAVDCPIILSTVNNVEDEAVLKTAIIEAVDKLNQSSATFGVTPDIIIAPTFADDTTVRSKLISVAERLKAITILDSKAGSETDAIKDIETVSSKRAVITNPEVLVYDTTTSKDIKMPLSPIVAGLIAKTDSESEYGFADSFSNRVILGISGLSRNIDFELGEDCEADRLRSKNISTVIRYDGYRTWGAETLSDDEAWRDLTRVRVFDRLSKAAQKGVLFAVDKKADQLFYAKKSVEEFLRSLTGAKVLLGYSVTWDEEQNTNTAISAGKFYLNIETQNNPITKRLELDFAYVDSYGDTLLDELKK